MNEVLTLGTALVSLTLTMFLARFGREWLFVIIGTNMVLISTFGAKLIEVFGFVTNVGNVFYATTFFAIYLLFEHYDKESAWKGVWVGFLPIIVFVIMSQMTKTFDQALHSVFQFTPRIFLASICAYFISQYANVFTFSKIKEKTGERMLAVRAIGAVIIGQLIDSVIFFSVAFIEIVSSTNLLEIMTVGYVMKVGVGLVAIPFLYWSRLLFRAR